MGLLISLQSQAPRGYCKPDPKDEPKQIAKEVIDAEYEAVKPEEIKGEVDFIRINRELSR